MGDAWLWHWENRYKDGEYAYGEDPNEFFRGQVTKLPAGKILLGAEGEGRNAVFAAKQGWRVSAFDISSQGKSKALQLAQKNGVSIEYRVGELPKLDYERGTFDAIGLVYAHFPAEIRSDYHRLLDSHLRVGGTVILEAFGKNHREYRLANPNVGGPADLPTLFSREEVRADFPGYKIAVLEERVITLREGKFHDGEGSVIRFVGRKVHSGYPTTRS